MQKEDLERKARVLNKYLAFREVLAYLESKGVIPVDRAWRDVDSMTWAAQYAANTKDDIEWLYEQIGFPQP